MLILGYNSDGTEGAPLPVSKGEKMQEAAISDTFLEPHKHIFPVTPLPPSDITRVHTLAGSLMICKEICDRLPQNELKVISLHVEV